MTPQEYGAELARSEPAITLAVAEAAARIIAAPATEGAAA